MTEDETFDAAVAQVGRAINDFVNGDPGPFRACWLPEAHTSIFGGRGGHETGWNQVDARLGWAAAGFRGGWTEQEILVSHHGPDLGYTVCLERGEQTVQGRESPAASTLRVTHIFRRQAGRWGIVHRHADPIADQTPPESILAEG